MRRRPDLAVRASDPFCSAACCRAYHAVANVWESCKAKWRDEGLAA